MRSRIVLNSTHFELTIKRLCYELIENHNDFSNSVIIGLQPRGVLLAQRLHHHLNEILGEGSVDQGALDVTFFRDDFRRGGLKVPRSTDMNFLIEDKNVILVDDVLYTGRTIRAGLDAMMSFGRPKRVELLVLIDRRWTRDLPISANYTGKRVDSIVSDRVEVKWKETDDIDEVILLTPEKDAE